MDSMEIDDTYINKSFRMDDPISKVDFQRRKQPSRCRCTSVCLGLLCAVLLAGNIGQMFYYEIINRLMLADPAQASYTLEKLNNTQEDRLQRSYDALTAEKKQLEVRLSNLTIEKDQMQTSFNNVGRDLEALRTNHNDLTASKNQLQTNYNNLQRSNVKLQTTFNQVQGNYSSLKRDKDQLQASYNTLKQERDQMQTSFNNMQRSLETLRTNHNDLTASNNQLQTNYNNLQRSNVKLQTTFNQGNYSSLKRDKDQLQASYNTLKREKEQLQTNYSILATSQEQLQKKLDKVRRRIDCQSGWQKFELSCYFVSTTRKCWSCSRRDCIAKGGDLVVIDSRDEQEFISRILKKGDHVWIGLSDRVIEGNWMWVNGDPVTTAYWEPGQPNSVYGEQDCGSFMQRSSGIGEWNDLGCDNKQIYICEL